MSAKIEIDDEEFEQLEEIISRHAPDLHGCARAEMHREICDGWLPKVVAKSGVVVRPEVTDAQVEAALTALVAAGGTRDRKGWRVAMRSALEAAMREGGR